MKSGRIVHRRVFSIVKLIVVIIIVGTLAVIAVPLYLHHIEMSRKREALVIFNHIIISQKVEKIRTGKHYSASTNAEFEAKGVDVSKAKSFIFETFPTPDGGFTVRGTPKNASDAPEDLMTYTYPLPKMKPYNLLLTHS